MRDLLIRPRADADLEGIWAYTFAEWGEAQADRYLRDIAEALHGLREQPESGRSADSIRAGYRYLRIGRHLAFYTYTEQAVSVRRVLHDQMDFGRHLQP